MPVITIENVLFLIIQSVFSQNTIFVKYMDNIVTLQILLGGFPGGLGLRGWSGFFCRGVVSAGVTFWNQLKQVGTNT